MGEGEVSGRAKGVLRYSLDCLVYCTTEWPEKAPMRKVSQKQQKLKKISIILNSGKCLKFLYLEIKDVTSRSSISPGRQCK